MLPFARVSIIGLGLIGSSIARAVRQHMPTVRLTGHDADPGVRATAERLELCDDIADTPGAAVTDADLVILCVPVGASPAKMTRRPEATGPSGPDRTSPKTSTSPLNAASACAESS